MAPSPTTHQRFGPPEQRPHPADNKVLPDIRTRTRARLGQLNLPGIRRRLPPPLRQRQPLLLRRLQLLSAAAAVSRMAVRASTGQNIIGRTFLSRTASAAADPDLEFRASLSSMSVRT